MLTVGQMWGNVYSLFTNFAAIGRFPLLYSSSASWTMLDQHFPSALMFRHPKLTSSFRLPLQRRISIDADLRFRHLLLLLGGLPTQLLLRPKEQDRYSRSLV